MTKLSIVVPTTRGTPLFQKWGDEQSYQDFEVLVQREEGLVNARNSGWRRAKNEIVSFIDDDVVLDKNWTKEISISFDAPRVGCVMGATIIPAEFQKNRDNVWSLGVMQTFFKRIGSIQACNMSFRKEVLKELDGFDEIYKGIGEWSEPDLVFRVKKLGYNVIHNNKAIIYHCPSQAGIYQQRGKDSYNRMRNFCIMRKKWLTWDFNLFIVVIIFNVYWIYKFFRTRKIAWLGGLLGNF